MILIHKDGVQVMEIDDSADEGMKSMLKAQGWSAYSRVIGIHPLADIVLQMKLKDLEVK